MESTHAKQAGKWGSAPFRRACVLAAVGAALALACGAAPALSWAGAAGQAGSGTQAAVQASDTISMRNVTVTIEPQTYDGLPKQPKPTVRYLAQQLVEGVDYQIDPQGYANNVNAGTNTASLSITGIGQFSDTRRVPFTIRPASSKTTDVQITEWMEYTGSPVAQKVAVSAKNPQGEDVALVEGKDYTWEYADLEGNPIAAPSEIGEYKVVVSFMGNYIGTSTAGFLIIPIDIQGIGDVKRDLRVTGWEARRYTGQPITHDIVVTLDAKTLVEGTDYEVTYENNVEVGRAALTVTGIGHYGNSHRCEFEITPVPISEARVAFAPQTYTGQALTPEPLSVTWGDRTLVKGVDYRITAYSSNTNVGTGHATIEGLGTFGQTMDATFAINRPNESGNRWIRLAGSQRYQTMSLIAQTAFSALNEVSDGRWAVVATGAKFPDALAASSLAGAYQCPVILTRSGTLAPEALLEIQRLRVNKVCIVGGHSAVSPQVEAALWRLGIETRRAMGSTRQDTSVHVMETFSVLMGKNYDTVIIASGQNFPDSLSIGPYSYAKHAPILLAGKNGRLTSFALTSIKTHSNIKNVIVVGGDRAVDFNGVKAQLGEGYSYTRLAGANRYETSAAIARFELEQGMTCGAPALSTGAKFPDALAGAALCGKNNSILVLASDSNRTAIKVLEQSRAQIVQGYLLGGTGAVSASLATYVRSNAS